MSEPKHTEGLIVDSCLGHSFTLLSAAPTGSLIASITPNDGNMDQCLADFKHIVACWNACDGINPGAVPDLAEVVTRLIQGIRLGTLRLIDKGGHAPYRSSEIESMMEAALAKAKPPDPDAVNLSELEARNE